MNIQIINTGEQKIYHDYFKPFVCKTDIDLPKMYNQGYNSFRFIGGEPEFTGINMPEILRSETKNYLFYEAQILVLRTDGTTCSGRYNKTVNKSTHEVKEIFCFD